MLYAINKSPLSSNALQSALRVAPAGSPFLLYEDGVYAAMPGAQSEQTVLAALAQHALYALDADLEARGIEKIIPGVQVIGYEGWVALIEQYNVVPWL